MITSVNTARPRYNSTCYKHCLFTTTCLEGTNDFTYVITLVTTVYVTGHDDRGSEEPRVTLCRGLTLPEKGASFPAAPTQYAGTISPKYTSHKTKHWPGTQIENILRLFNLLVLYTIQINSIPIGNCHSEPART